MPRTTKSVTITARITPALAKKLNAYAKAAKRSKSTSIQIILEENIDREMDYLEAIDAGFRQIDEGKGIPHDEAMRQLQEFIARKKREKRKAA